ncbi:MAG TPA: cytochrome P450 [Streptosporangiaceae bacterium]|jgi:cytochrome P450|nr:cytochrome P450 [Streptosporangiaceae bacterium]
MNVTDVPAAKACGRAPGALPLLGHTLALLRDPLRFLSSLPEHGDLVRIRLGLVHAIVVCDPELTRQMLLDGRTFEKGGPLVDKASEVFGNGLGTCPHGEHRRQRRLTQPAFHQARLPGYAQTMADQCQAVTGAWRDGQIIDALPEMTALTIRVIAATMFGTALPPAAHSQILDDFAAVMDGIYAHMILPLPFARLPTPGNRRYQRARARLRHSIGQITDAYRADGADHGDLLSMLVATRDTSMDAGATGQSFSDAEITDQILTFLFGGTETSAALLTSALYLLARHPGIQRQLQDEVDTVLAGATPAYADVPRLELTGRVLTETLRIYPPAWIITRTTTTDTRLGAHVIPAGTVMAYSPYLIHHRPDVHAGPDDFDPGRWTSPPARDAFIPFGAGARKCIGDAFAMTEATLVLASIARHWQVDFLPGKNARPKPRTTLSPRRLRLRVTARGTQPQHGPAESAHLSLGVTQ